MVVISKGALLHGKRISEQGLIRSNGEIMKWIICRAIYFFSPVCYTITSVRQENSKEIKIT